AKVAAVHAAERVVMAPVRCTLEHGATGLRQHEDEAQRFADRRRRQRAVDDSLQKFDSRACLQVLGRRHARQGALRANVGLVLPPALANSLSVHCYRSLRPVRNVRSRAGGAPTAAPPRHALAVDTVRFVGEAVAAVVANSREEARDALEAIDVRYEPLPSVVDSAAAVAPGAPLVWPEASGNIAAEIRHGDGAATAKAFASAAHVVALDL